MKGFSKIFKKSKKQKQGENKDSPIKIDAYFQENRFKIYLNKAKLGNDDAQLLLSFLYEYVRREFFIFGYFY